MHFLIVLPSPARMTPPSCLVSHVLLLEDLLPSGIFLTINISFPGLPRQLSTNWVAGNDRSVLAHRWDIRSLKKVWGPVSLRPLRGDSSFAAASGGSWQLLAFLGLWLHNPFLLPLSHSLFFSFVCPLKEHLSLDLRPTPIDIPGLPPLEVHA